MTGLGARLRRQPLSLVKGDGQSVHRPHRWSLLSLLPPAPEATAVVWETLSRLCSLHKAPDDLCALLASLPLLQRIHKDHIEPNDSGNQKEEKEKTPSETPSISESLCVNYELTGFLRFKNYFNGV